jgi:hypothetical protein
VLLMHAELPDAGPEMLRAAIRELQGGDDGR